eukprot:scaffold99528_cov48-Phaeocystis_antarctica.AAC.1
MAMGYPRYPEPPRALTKRARRAEARGEARGRKAEERRRRAEAKAEAREAKARANRAKVKAKGQRQLMAQLSSKAKRHQVKSAPKRHVKEGVAFGCSLHRYSDSSRLSHSLAAVCLYPPYPRSRSVAGRMSEALLEAVRGLHVADPDLGVKPLLAKLREQQPDLGAGNKEVREALKALKAESEAKVAAAAA